MESSECTRPLEEFGAKPSSPPCINEATFMCNALFKNTGEVFSRWGQEAQNQRGIGPVLAVDTYKRVTIENILEKKVNID